LKKVIIFIFASLYIQNTKTVNNDPEYAIKEFTSVYKEFHDDKNLSKKEKHIVYAIYTWLLYFQISIQ